MIRSIKKISRFIISKLFWGGFQYLLSDRYYAKIRYWLVMGDYGNFENPNRFTEKIQYIKLYERTELRKKVAHRLEVRDYVSDRIGKEHLIPLFGTYNELTPEIWDDLPNSFVLKANHGCEMVKIVEDKKTLRFKDVELITKKWLSTDYYKVGYEWVYKDLPRFLLAEKLLTTSDGEIPNDWKFFCFHGKVQIIQADFGRFSAEQTRNLYDRDFTLIDAELLYPQHPEKIKKPPLFGKAIQIAEDLSKDFNFIRVDLYITTENIFFGELTNYPGNGFIPFQPELMEYKVGEMLELNN